MIRIVTDSAADFELAELQELNITLIPLTVSFGQQVYQETVELGKDQFYELMLGGEELPKTAQPAPQLLLDVIEDAKAKGDDVIYISISAGISGTYQTARMSAELAEYDRCWIVDSANAAGGQRLLVEYAAKLRDQGMAPADLVAAVEAAREKLTLYACIDTLEYLHRGGRISGLAYTLGNLAQIKPIISLKGGISIPAKAMGMKKGIGYQCKQMEQKKPNTDFPIYVMYTYDRSNGEALAKKIRDLGYDIPDSRIVNVGAAIGTHIGPNACGVVYVAE